MLEPGEVVQDRYRIVRTIATGGMGVVYEVERIHDRQPMALKAALATRGRELARLAREAQLATRMRHPNVVAVLDADVAESGYVYLVMELVEGSTLADRGGAQPIAWSLPVLVQILRGLEAMHAEGVVHRDLKPPNVLLSGDLEHAPQVKLTDFGISHGLAERVDLPSQPPPDQQSTDKETTLKDSRKAKAETRRRPDGEESSERSETTSRQRRPTPQLTRQGAISGTPSYVAPELALRGATPGPAVDVFAFGVVAYRMLTGTAPHVEPPLHAVLDGREPSPHVPIAELCPGLVQRVAALIDACLSSVPEQRPAISELLDALEAAHGASTVAGDTDAREASGGA